MRQRKLHINGQNLKNDLMFSFISISNAANHNHNTQHAPRNTFIFEKVACTLRRRRLRKQRRISCATVRVVAAVLNGVAHELHGKLERLTTAVRLIKNIKYY